ncbi:hypothetical protein NQ318_019285 [Aromia moschata]|uniref:Uncharacterized protein n=1 Tax=Aromia moschata TaxID=1265417 RepID=A0AAV8YZN2_9CUCU|nr:hypothetical protein NQ318_019285 [Aromia moschata]
MFKNEYQFMHFKVGHVQNNTPYTTLYLEEPILILKTNTAKSYRGLVKLAGNMPLSPLSFMPINQPSSCKIEKRL